MALVLLAPPKGALDAPVFRGTLGGWMSALRSASFLAVPVLLSTGCNGIFWGNLGVLCVTVGIFLGTVFLSRTSSDASRTATSSQASSTQRT